VVAASIGTRYPLDGLLCAACVRRMNDIEQTVPGYRLLREIGRGSMGIVYLAGRDTDGKFVALKTITPAVAAGGPALQRFLREADILRQLDHPHIVRFLDMNGDDGQLWFAMDFVSGTDAGRLLSSEGPLAIPRAVGLISQLLEALEYAHGRGFVHRDIKPGNLLVTRRAGRETAVLADFGLARVYQASQLSGLTMTDATGGTPMFMPPEQITNYRETKPPADQYAAAMTLYNLLTGQYAFDSPPHLKLWIAMILEDDPVPIRTRRPEVPQELAEVIHRAMQKEAKDRFPDVRALRLALKKFGP
jgi:serine/threonine-protein kinase